MKKFLLFIGFCFFLLSGLFAQFSSINNYVTRTWSSADGLPGNSVLDIVQAKDGYLYFGTYECLVKFDGFEFQNLNKYSDSKMDFISARSIFEDSKGFMWVGSNDEGIQKFSRNSVEHISTENGLPNNSVRSFIEDRFGNVWVGTASGVVYITPEGSVVKPAASEKIDISHVIVSQLYCDTAGRIWMLTTEENGIYLYSGNSFQRFENLNYLGNFIPSSISQDRKGNFWFGLGANGVVKVSNGVIDKIKSGTIIDYEPSKCFYSDSTGSLWFGTERGLVLFSDGVYTTYDDNTQIQNASINKILEDREHNIWVATDNGGIGKISLGKFRMNKLSSSVNAICEDKNNRVWLGTDEGLLCYENDLSVQNELTDFCKNVRIRHVGVAQNGDILVNCYSKPAQIRYTKEGILSWSTDENLAGNKTRVSIETKKGDIYCGTTTGLSVIHRDGTIKNFADEDGFDNKYIMCIYQDNDGFVWVGTDGGGVYLMKDDAVVKKISTDSGLAGNVVFKISQDIEGRFWICTGSGISCFRGNAKSLVESELVAAETAESGGNLGFVNLTSANGLGSDAIFQLLVDENDYAWMISNRGISSVDFNDILKVVDGKLQHIDCKFYNQNDGLKSSGTNSTALSMKDKYGRLWFTMADGFAVYDPVRTNVSSILPIIQIVGINVDDKAYKTFDKPIEIPAGTKHIDIKFTGLSFTASDRNRFSYMLEGYDSDFSELTAFRTVSFTNLKPGKYTFKVNVINGDGVKSEEPASVVLIQKAFFYQQAWFWILVALVVAGIIVLSFVLLSYNNKKRRLVLETEIQKATVELEMAKDDSDRLLKNILPVSIAERMKGLAGEKTIADVFDNVTILFSDIVGFTKKTSKESAEDIVKSLNDLFSRFDERAEQMGVEKIKTIGDSYMAACGVPSENENHALVMFNFALGMYKDLEEYNKTAKIKFELRIGLNSGKVIAGVIGLNKFIYDIWGDAVNVASRMESCCTPGHIRFTDSVRKNLEKQHISFDYKKEECDVKGKGLMMTYEIE